MFVSGARFEAVERRLAVAEGEARSLEAERDRLLSHVEGLEGEVSILRRMLELSKQINELRDDEATGLSQSVLGLSADLDDAYAALDLALQGCIDREAVTAPVQVAGSLYDEAVES